MWKYKTKKLKILQTIKEITKNIHFLFRYTIKNIKNSEQ